MCSETRPNTKPENVTCNFMTEKLIQQYIWDNRENFSDFILEVEIPKKRNIEKPWEFTPSDIIYNSLIDKFEDFYNAVYELYLFGFEVPLKKNNDSTIRADLLGVLAGRNGVSIIEIKKSKQTERQAYTELLAYGSHIRTKFAPMSKVDVNYILISPMEERIVREATIQNLIYDNYYVFALIPEYQNDDITTLKLRPWIPTFEEVDSIIDSCFSESNFDAFKVTWDGLPGEWSPKEKGENPDKYMIERLNKVSSFAAQLMESKGIHGFVYASQTWSELRDYGHLINSIVLCGINPYKATKNRVLINDYALSSKEANEVNIEEINMLNIIPELESFAKEENINNNYLSDLSMTWSNEITGIGFEIVKTLTMSTERNGIETSWGTFDWDIYQKNSIEDIYCHNFDIRVTGLIRDLFFKYSKYDFDYIKQYGTDEHPTYWDGDIPNEFIEMVTSQYYVRKFIKRLFNPYSEFEDEFDNEEFDDNELKDEL